jgi:hypothetical protein
MPVTRATKFEFVISLQKAKYVPDNVFVPLSRCRSAGRQDCSSSIRRTPTRRERQLTVAAFREGPELPQGLALADKVIEQACL